MCLTLSVTLTFGHLNIITSKVGKDKNFIKIRLKLFFMSTNKFKKVKTMSEAKMDSCLN